MKPIRNSAKAIIVRNNQLLTLKCIDMGTIFYQLPGGGQQNGETLTNALKRECLEEISAEVAVGDLLFIREYIGGKHGPEWHQVEFMFSCALPDSVECKQGTEPDKVQIAIEWLPLEQLDQYNLYPKALIPGLMNGFSENTSVYLGDVE